MSDVSETDDRPWHQVYEEHDTPVSLEPYPEESLHALLYRVAEEDPESGLVQGGEKITYPTLLEHAERLAAALAERGVGPGDRVATVLPTSVQFTLATHGITIAGGVHVPNDFLDAEEDLVYRLEQADPTVLIGNDEHRELLERLRDRLDIEHLILTQLADYGGDPEHPPVEGAEWLPDVIDDADPVPPDVQVGPEDTHTILFTGGTTGRPKGCVLTHRNVRANVHQLTRGETGESSDSPLGGLVRQVVFALPQYHTYGYLIGNLLLAQGLDILLVSDPRDVDRIVEIVEERGAYVVIGVPAQFIDLVEESVSSNIIGISGSAPLTADTQERFAEDNMALSQGYGLSEMLATHVDMGSIETQLGMGEPDEDRLDRPTIGVPLPDTDVKIVDVETGEALDLWTVATEDQEGELYLNGPQRMQGYLDDSLEPFDADGFVATGDVVTMDPKGRFYVVDRVKNMINVSGLKVYTEEVDEVLHAHPEIKRAATVGIPDPDRPGSEQVAIAVEPVEGADLAAAEVREHLEGQVPRQAMPDVLEFVDRIPLTDVGKIDKVALRERHE